MAQGAVFGAAFGGLVDGIPRAVRALAYYREMKKVQPDLTMRPETQEAAIQGAEAAIVRGDDPIKAVRRAALSEPSPARAPLVLDESLRVTPEPTALAPDPITSEPLPPTAGIQSTTDQVVAVGKSGIAKASKATKEVLGWLKRNGGVEPTGWLGAELKARGLNHKSMPGLFKKGGRTEIDNIVADELDQTIPGISYRAGRDGTGNYIDRDGLLRVLDEELAPPRPQKAYDPRTSYADPDPEDRGFMVDLSARQFAEPDTWRETLETDFDAYLERSGVSLLPREVAEIKQILGTRGGDAGDLIHSVSLRDIDEGETALLRTMRGEAYGREVPWGDEAGMGAGADRPGGIAPVQSEASAGDAAAVGARDLEPAGFERTAIGDQAVIPGTRRVDEYSKHVAKAQAEAKAIQSKMRSGRSQERVEDDAGGLFGGAQRDMFSDPADPKSKPTQIAMMEDLRDALNGRGSPDDVSMTFVTEKGSKYEVFGNGTTKRDKAARSDAGHEGDSGPKPRTERTVYVDSNAAALSAAGMQGIGPKGARVVIKDGKASLLWWNDAGGKWGRAPSGSDIPVFDEPAIGRYPLELWKKADDVPDGYEGYRGMHAGNPIVSIEPVGGRGDFMVDVGNGPVPASTLLKEMDDDLDFEDILNACGKRGPA